MVAITREDVANMALDILTEGEIDSLDENIKPARMLSRHFDVVVEAELKANAWTFAILSEELSGTDLGTEEGTLNWQFELPEDALRPLPLTYNGQPDGIPITWRQEGGYVYTDQDSPRIVRYIANVQDPADWDALFTQAVAAKLALAIGHGLTGKASFEQIAQAKYDRAIAEAKRCNAIERSGRLYRESWALARGDNRFERP